jgi:hypothetical protein
VVSTFDRSLLRYVLRFDSVEARYLKAVNTSGNDVAEVLVTEIEFLEGQEGVQTRSRDLHGGRILARWSQQPTSALSTALETSVQSEPGTSQVGRNTQVTLSTQASYQATETTNHSLRWSQTRREFSGDQQDLREDQASYGFLWDPSERMSLRSSADARWTHLAGRRSLEIYSASSQLRAELLKDLSVSAVPAITRREDHDSDQSSDQLSMAIGLEAVPYQSLTTNVSWRHQAIVRDNTGRLAPSRDLLDLSGMWRLTPSLQIRSRWVWIQDEQHSSRQEHLASWQLSRHLRISGSSTIEDSSGDRHSLRYNLSTSLDLGRRTTAYVRFTVNDLRRSNGIRSEFFEQGFRTTF